MKNNAVKKERKIKLIEGSSRQDFENQLNQVLSEGYRVLKWNADEGMVDCNTWQAIMLKDDFLDTKNDYMEISFDNGKFVTSDPKILEDFKKRLVFGKSEEEG